MDSMPMIRIAAGSKRPIHCGWSTSPPDRLEDFLPGENVGWRCGPVNATYSLVCIDIDSDSLLNKAAAILPATRAVDSRKERPRSHYWYLVPNTSIDPKDEADNAAAAFSFDQTGYRGPKKRTYFHKGTGKLVEVLGTGQQAVVPGSVVDGSQRRWEFEDPYPSVVEWSEIIQAVERLATAGGWSQPLPLRAVQIPPRGEQSTELDRRVTRYLQCCDPAISGQGGHNTAMRVVGNVVQGFDLESDRAFVLLQDWNSRCQPPWSDKELRHKIESAQSRTPPNGEARGWLLREYLAETVHNDIDISGLIDQVNIDAVSPPTQKKTASMAFLDPETIVPPGLLGEIVCYCLETSLYPQPELALAGAIALMSVLTGRVICDRIGTRTNLYIVGLGPTRCGKDHPRQVNKQIVEAAKCEDLLGGERIASHAAVISEACERKRVLFQLDEIGMLLATTKSPTRSPHLYQINQTLLDFWGSSKTTWYGESFADTSKRKIIYNPHVVVFGTATPETFWRAITRENLTAGLIGRLLCFDSKYVAAQRCDGMAVPASIVDQVRAWSEYRGEGGNLDHRAKTVPHTDEAWNRWWRHQEQIHEQRIVESTDRAAIWSGSAEKANKLALIASASRCGPGAGRIEIEDVNWAIKVANFLTRRLVNQGLSYIHENQHSESRHRLLQLIGGQKDGISRCQLLRAARWLKAAEIKDHMQILIDSGEVVVQEIASGGRPTTIYKRGEE